MVTVKRSGARQTWQIMYGKVCISVCHTKKQAEEQALALNKKYAPLIGA